MIVKVGDLFFDANYQPIMLILSDKEKAAIGGMQPNEHRYILAPGAVDDEERARIRAAADAWSDDVPGWVFERGCYTSKPEEKKENPHGKEE